MQCLTTKQHTETTNVSCESNIGRTVLQQEHSVKNTKWRSNATQSIFTSNNKK